MLLERLRDEHLLHRVQETSAGEAEGWALAMAPGQIAIPRLLEVGEKLAARDRGLPEAIPSESEMKGPGGDVMRRMVAAEREAVRGATLASVLNGGG